MTLLSFNFQCWSKYINKQNYTDIYYLIYGLEVQKVNDS